ncbi:MAG: phenylalanine--tRNA ligase subunit beta [bacterium]|nr:phenylalanine--tRNA ligase subunit beta [bacterium]
MKVPINWLKDYTKIPQDLNVLTDKLTMVGHMLDKKETVNSETIIDLELRGNRADCYSILGIAREVSAIFKTPLKTPLLYEDLKKVKELKVGIKIETPLVKRVMAVIIKNIKLAPSPSWMVNRLSAYGVPSINNIVDTTNYVMIETGQPMHAFDIDKLGNEINIRLAKKGEKLVTFEGTIIKLTNEDLIFANEKGPLSIAGAIGGRNYSISESTKNILLEAANYNRANIRRTCRRHSLFTEAGLRHEKELDPNLVEEGIKRFLKIIKENNWGEINSGVFDHYPNPKKGLILSLLYDNLWNLTGFQIDRKDVSSNLASLGFKIIEESTKGIKVLCPAFRTDVTQEADLVEEVVRLTGYDKIPLNTLALEIPKLITPNFIRQEKKAKEAVMALGFDEQISLPFVKENDLGINILLDFDSKISAEPVIVANPPSPDFKVMRMSLLPNLLDFAEKIKNERGEKAFLFEIGKIYFKEKNKYEEKRRLGLIYWQKSGSAFSEFKGLLEVLFKQLSLENINFEEKQLNSFDQPQFTAVINKKQFVFGGLAKENTFYAEIDLDAILGQDQVQKVLLWPKFPPIIEDISFIVPHKTKVGGMIQSIESVSPKIKSVQFLNAYENTRSFRIFYQNPHKTLTNKEILEVRKKIEEIIEKEFKAKLKSNMI